MKDNLAYSARSDQAFAPEHLAGVAKYLLASRRRRDTAFAKIDFGEPAWDMLLDLYTQHAAGRRVSIHNLCEASAVPTTTALRWIGVMVGAGQLVRQPDANDRRRAFVSLAPDLCKTIERYLADEWRRLEAMMP